MGLSCLVLLSFRHLHAIRRCCVLWTSLSWGIQKIRKTSLTSASISAIFVLIASAILEDTPHSFRTSGVSNADHVVPSTRRLGI